MVGARQVGVGQVEAGLGWEAARSQLLQSPNQDFVALARINLYSAADSDSLTTQVAPGRRFRVESQLNPALEIQVQQEIEPRALRVRLGEDDYPGWLRREDWDRVQGAIAPAPALEPLDRGAIAARLPAVIAFGLAALATPNEYLWGGTLAPHYDCSGLMQAAFASQGIWLPRDAYQQEAFLDPLAVHRPGLDPDRAEPEVDLSKLEPGDLVFFGPREANTEVQDQAKTKATHVGLYLGQGRYLHSSGKDMGRNGIAVDQLSDRPPAPAVSRAYYRLFRGAGRVTQSFRSSPEFSARKP